MSLSLIALHPATGMAVNKPFSLSPNRADSAPDTISAETPCAPFAWPSEAARRIRPATHDVRASTRNDPSLSVRYHQVKQAAR